MKHPFRVLFGLIVMCMGAWLFISAFNMRLFFGVPAAFIGFALFATGQWIAFVYAFLKR